MREHPYAGGIAWHRPGALAADQIIYRDPGCMPVRFQCTGNTGTGAVGTERMLVLLWKRFEIAGRVPAHVAGIYGYG